MELVPAVDLHQSWGGWDSRTSSLGHNLHSTTGRREAGPRVSCPWESKTQQSDCRRGGDVQAFYKYSIQDRLCFIFLVSVVLGFLENRVGISKDMERIGDSPVCLPA